MAKSTKAKTAKRPARAPAKSSKVAKRAPVKPSRAPSPKKAPAVPKAPAAKPRSHCIATDPFGDPCQSSPRPPTPYCTIHSYLAR